MPINKEQKKKIVENLKEKIDKQKSMVFVDFTGVKVKDLFSLRNKLKGAGSELKVAKKTLMGLAFKNKGLDFDFKKMKNEIALIFGFEDEISAAKITHQFSKVSPNLKILGGIFENKFIEPLMVKELAQIPSKNELLGKLVASISSPISGLVNVLEGNIKGLIYILKQIKTQ